MAGEHTRAEPMRYRGFRIHNETISESFVIYRGKVNDQNLLGVGLATLEEATARVDQIIAEDEAATKLWYGVTDTDGKYWTELLCGDCASGYRCRNYTVQLLAVQLPISPDAKCHCGDH